jgi:hypothetical protein
MDSKLQTPHTGGKRDTLPITHLPTTAELGIREVEKSSFVNTRIR